MTSTLPAVGVPAETRPVEPETEAGIALLGITDLFVDGDDEPIDLSEEIVAVEAEAAAAERKAIRAAWLDRAGDGGFFTALLKDILDAREPKP